MDWSKSLLQIITDGDVRSKCFIRVDAGPQTRPDDYPREVVPRAIQATVKPNPMPAMNL